MRKPRAKPTIGSTDDWIREIARRLGLKITINYTSNAPSSLRLCRIGEPNEYGKIPGRRIEVWGGREDGGRAVGQAMQGLLRGIARAVREIDGEPQT